MGQLAIFRQVPLKVGVEQQYRCRIAVRAGVGVAPGTDPNRPLLDPQRNHRIKRCMELQRIPPVKLRILSRSHGPASIMFWKRYWFSHMINCLPVPLSK